MRSAINCMDIIVQHITNIFCVLRVYGCHVIPEGVESSGLHSYQRQGCNNIGSVAPYVLRDLNTIYWIQVQSMNGASETEVDEVNL